MQGSEQLRVMCVDDDPDIVELLRVVVEYEVDFTVVAATTDAHEVIDLVGDHRPDVVILDRYAGNRLSAVADDLRVVPDTTSTGLIATLRALIPDATVVVFSGRERPIDVEGDVGDVWVQKPDCVSLWPAIRKARGLRSPLAG